MLGESTTSFDTSSSGLTAYSRLKEIKSKLAEIDTLINDASYDLILLISMPELGIPHIEKTSTGEEKEVITISPSVVISQLDSLRSMKSELSNDEYYWTQIYYQNLKDKDKRINELSSFMFNS